MGKGSRARICHGIAKMTGHDSDPSSNTDGVEKVGHIARTHPDAPVTCRTANQPLNRRPVDVNSALVSAGVSFFEAAQPKDPGYDWIATSGIGRKYFTGRRS